MKRTRAESVAQDKKLGRKEIVVETSGWAKKLCLRPFFEAVDEILLVSPCFLQWAKKGRQLHKTLLLRLTQFAH